ncbi:MAG: hypothetical protein K2P81_03970 [Bacteriovoracaceae bacterium]|nr:hypothetical protein [Bacteriovoracaceae bacterium]
MTSFVFAILLATLLRAQTVVIGRYSRFTLSALGSLIIVLLPLVAIFIMPSLSKKWINYSYLIGFSLSVVILVIRKKNWELYWPLILIWPTLPLIYAPDNLGPWLAMIAAEFLLLFAYQLMDPRSDYFKYGLLRLLFIFQFFVFENLFMQARPMWAGEILTILLFIFYVISFLKILIRAKRSQSHTWIFLIAYLVYGIMMVDKLVADVFKNNI